MRQLPGRPALGAGIAMLVATGAGSLAAEPLPAFDVELAQTSVSGLSSGAYIAGQFHVAFSSSLVGAGIIAGGPYNCAQGQLNRALNSCMATTLGPPDVERLVAAPL